MAWKETTLVLRTFLGEQIKTTGYIDATVEHNNQTAVLPLTVIEGEGPSLFGRNWLKSIQIDWKSIYTLKEGRLQSLLTAHRDVFREGVGKLQGAKAKIYTDPEATPKFCKACPILYSMKVKIEEELDRLVSLGILQPISFADWAPPIVPVLKTD